MRVNRRVSIWKHVRIGHGKWRYCRPVLDAQGKRVAMEVQIGEKTSLKVDLTGATLVQMTSTDLKPDQGHLHVILDDTLITMTSGLETVIPNVPPGKHLIKVEFMANDHAPFDPRVIVGVAFTVKA